MVWQRQTLQRIYSHCNPFQENIMTADVFREKTYVTPLSQGNREGFILKNRLMMYDDCTKNQHVKMYSERTCLVLAYMEFLIFNKLGAYEKGL